MNGSLFLEEERLETIFYFMVAFSLLGPSLGIPVTGEFKLTFFRIAFAILAIGVLIKLFKNKKVEMPHLFPLRWYIAFFMFWIAYSVLSLTWAVNITDAARYSIFLFMMILLTLSIPYFLTTEDKFWKIGRILLGVYVFIVYFGLIESVTWIHLPSSRVFDSPLPSDTITSVFTNQNDLATCITLSLPFLIAAIYMLPLKKKTKWFLYITGVISLYVLIGTGSRINNVLVIPTIAILFMISAPFVIKRDKLTKKNIGIAVIASLVAILLAVLLSATILQVKKSVYDPRAKILGSIDAITSDFKKGAMEQNNQGEVIRGKSGESVTVRLHLLINGMRFLQQSHYMGVGAGNIEPLMRDAPRVNKENMHNWWVEILVNFGVVTFILYMLLYVWMLWRLWKLAWLKTSPHLSPFIRWGALASLIALIGYIGGGVAPSTAIHYTPMWVIYGVALAVIVLGERQKRKNSEPAI